jgi:predicted RNA binding protein YcfA (HicA-like mRNA interferase family)
MEFHPVGGMSKHNETRERILSGTCNANVGFDDLCQFLNRIGFHNRTKGSHHIFSRKDIPDIINLQPARDGKAKPYQVKQVARLIKHFNLQ